MATSQELIDLIVGPQVPIGSTWFDQTQVERGKVHGRNFPAVPPTGTAFDSYAQNHYYDLGQAELCAYQRTGDPEFLSLFEKVEDSWWLCPWIDGGRNRNFSEAPPGESQAPTPRNSGIGGLILRAQNRPEMWDWINAYTRYEFDNWLKTRINDPALYLGVRDGAFCLMFAAWLSQALPDSFPLQSGGTATNGAALRAQYLADAEAIAVNYFGRLQYPDGSWRWDDPYYIDSDGGTLKGIMQPFMVGLLLRALRDAYRVSSNETVKTSIQNQITKACRHLYSDGPYSRQRVSVGVELRGFHYTYHGGTTVNPTKYEQGNLAGWDTTDPSDVQNARQAISTIVAAYGWCYRQTNDLFFKTAGDELWDSAYGATDGIHNYMAGDAKSYNQNCCYAPSYLAWAGMAEPPVQPPTQPTPPSRVPSPNGTKGPSIIDSELKVWTLGSGKQTLRDGVQMGGGQGTVYKYQDQIVYVLGMDSNWWKWEGSNWAMKSPDPALEPGIIPPVVEPPPATRTVTWPKQESKQNSILDAQWKDGFRLKRISPGSAEFEKVR